MARFRLPKANRAALVNRERVIMARTERDDADALDLGRDLRKCFPADVVAPLLAAGELFCESDDLDGHAATRLGPDGRPYCAEHGPR